MHIFIQEREKRTKNLFEEIMVEKIFKSETQNRKPCPRSPNFIRWCEFRYLLKDT